MDAPDFFLGIIRHGRGNTYNDRLTPLILGSAAVGALVSSIITLIGQAVERRARRRELLLSKSIELAELHICLL